MEEPDHNAPFIPFSSSALSSDSWNADFPGAEAAPSSSSEVREEVDDQNRPPQLFPQPASVSSHGHNFPSTDNEALTMIRDDTWSCFIAILAFWFFVSVALILGVYGSVNLRLGPNSSLLLKPNPLFVEYIKVEELDDNSNWPTLYGSYGDPPLDVVTTWFETRSASVPANTYKEWIYFLNEGSQINISYTVNSLSASSLILIIAQGNEGFAQWLQNPSYPNTTLSWNIIHGNGTIQQDILNPSSYYIAVGNLNSEELEVQLNLQIRALFYDTTEAYYKCTLAEGQCSLKLSLPNGNAAVLTSPGPTQGTTTGEWYVKLSYGPRWMTYIVGIGGMTVLMLLAFHLLNNFQCTRDDGTRSGFREMGSESAPLLSHKDDDLLSWGSSYDSVSQDDEDPEDGPAVGSLEGKPLKDGQYNNNIRRLCAICFDAPRDCFFLPCGHCVACFACGTRIAETTGSCPICRRNMKKVKKIFTV